MHLGHRPRDTDGTPPHAARPRIPSAGIVPRGSTVPGNHQHAHRWRLRDPQRLQRAVSAGTSPRRATAAPAIRSVIATRRVQAGRTRLRNRAAVEMAVPATTTPALQPAAARRRVCSWPGVWAPVSRGWYATRAARGACVSDHDAHVQSGRQTLGQCTVSGPGGSHCSGLAPLRVPAHEGSLHTMPSPHTATLQL